MRAWRIRQRPLRGLAGVFAWAVRTKSRKLSGLNNRRSFLSSLQAERFKIKVQADIVPGKGPLLGLPRVTFFHGGEGGIVGRGRGRERGRGRGRASDSGVSS